MLKEVPEIFTFPSPVNFSNMISALVRETYQPQNFPKTSTYFSSDLSLIRKLSNTDRFAPVFPSSSSRAIGQEFTLTPGTGVPISPKPALTFIWKCQVLKVRLWLCLTSVTQTTGFIIHSCCSYPFPDVSSYSQSVNCSWQGTSFGFVHAVPITIGFWGPFFLMKYK